MSEVKELIKNLCNPLVNDKIKESIINGVVTYNANTTPDYVVKFDDNDKPINPIKSEKKLNLDMKKKYDMAYNKWRTNIVKSFNLL